MNKTVQGKNINGEDVELNVEDLYFRPAVYGILIQDEKVLMMSQKFGYCLPGGALDLGETFEESLQREIREETGYEIEIIDVVEVTSEFFKFPPSSQKTFRDAHSIRMFFTCKILSEDKSNIHLERVEEEWNIKPEWVNLSDLENIKIGDSADIVGIIKKAQK